MLPKGETRKECFIVEEVKAWEECDHQYCVKGKIADGFPPYNQDCTKCHGEGGRWHEAVRFVNCELTGRPDQPMVGRHGIAKSSILIRRWETCRSCLGIGKTRVIRKNGNFNCWRCEGTGAEPDSQGEWEIKE